MTQDKISVKDSQELLDYLNKITRNNYFRITEIWTPIEQVLVAYTDHCISQESKFKSENPLKGFYTIFLNKRQKTKSLDYQIGKVFSRNGQFGMDS